MIINGKSIQGIFLYSRDVEYEKGDFVVSDDCIYICTASNPTNETNNTVSGIDPSKDTTGNFKAYPGDMISSAEEYYNYVENNTTWQYRYSLDEVNEELNYVYTNIVSVESLPPLNEAYFDRIYKVTGGDTLIFAWKDRLKDKYISGSVLNQILQDSFFGVNEGGIIVNPISENENSGNYELSVNGNIYNIGNNNVLNTIIRLPELNNGMFTISRGLTGIASYTNPDTATTANVLLKQYTYYDATTGTSSKRIRIQEILDPEFGTSYYRWSEGVDLSNESPQLAYDPNRIYEFNEIATYNGQSWVSLKPNNRNNTPENNSEYWKVYNGGWSYNEIKEWRSTYEINQNQEESNNLLTQIAAIRAYYEKKINELEATREQLVGTFCNRNVATNLNGNYDTDQEGNVVLTAGENVIMHSSWEFIDNYEESLLASQGVSNFNELFSLFPNIEFVNTYLNPVALGCPVVVRVGTSNNYHFAYTYNNEWTEAGSIEAIMFNLNRSSVSDIFLIDDETFNSLINLPPDYPFNVFLKNESTLSLCFAPANRRSNPSRRSYSYLSNNLLEESGVPDSLTTIYYEDLISMNTILSTTFNGNGNYCNLFACIGTAQTDGQYSDSRRMISIPLIYPAETSNTNSLYLYRSYFYGEIPQIGTENSIYYALNNNQSPIGGLPIEFEGDNFSRSYKKGEKFILKSSPSDDTFGKIYEVREPIDNTISVDPGIANFIENWENVVKSYSWKASYSFNLKVKEDIEDLITHLRVPYRARRGEPNSTDHNSLWQSLVFGPSDYELNEVYYAQNFPKNSLIVADHRYFTNKIDIIGDKDQISSNIPPIHGDPNVWIELDIKPILPDYNQIFRGNWIDILMADSEAADENETLIIEFNTNSFRSLNNEITINDIPGFFCIIFPSFRDPERNNEISFIGKYDYGFPDIPSYSYYAWFDFHYGICFLRKTTDRNNQYYSNEGRYIDEFLIDILEERYLRNYGSSYGHNLPESMEFWKTEFNIIYPFINTDTIQNGIEYFTNVTFNREGISNGLNLLFRLDSKTTIENNYNHKYKYTTYIRNLLQGTSVFSSVNTEDSPTDPNPLPHRVNKLLPKYISFYEPEITHQIYDVQPESINQGSMGLSSVQISPIYSNYVRDVIRIGTDERNEYLYYTRDKSIMELIHQEDKTVSIECCVDTISNVSYLYDDNSTIKKDIGDCYYCSGDGKVYRLSYNINPGGRKDLVSDSSLSHLRDQQKMYWEENSTSGNKYYDYTFTNIPNKDIYQEQLQGHPVEKIDDTRDLNLTNDILSNLNSTTDLNYIDRVLASLKPKVTCIINYRDIAYYSITDGEVGELNMNLDTVINSIKSNRLNINESITDTSPYFIPYHVIADTSELASYPMEYRYRYSQTDPSASIEQWNLGSNQETELMLNVSGSSDYDPAQIYNTDDTVYYSNVIWKCLQDNVENQIPVDGSSYWARYSLLDSITAINNNLLTGYSNLPIRVICKSVLSGVTHYYINGNYWKHGKPAPGTGYNSSPDYDCIYDNPNDLPDAFNLGKKWAKIVSGGTEDYWMVIENNGWLDLYRENPTIRPSWYNNETQSIYNNYISAEEALFDALHTNYTLDNNNKVTGICYQSRWYTQGQKVVYGNIIWKCKQGTHIIPSNNAYWEPEGDPLFNTITFIPSVLSLQQNVSPSTPFRMFAKAGPESDYLVAFNTTQSGFDEGSFIITVLIYESTLDNKTKTYSITLDIEDPCLYYITNDLTLEVISDGVNDDQRILKLGGNNSDRAYIKNIYYRYTL